MAMETTDIIALSQAGLQTLSFSQAIANPVFAYVSLNGNGYGFDQDFDILSVGCGYWGCGNVTKNVIDHGGGVMEYQLIGSGEPHGAIRFKGSFDTVTWNSLTNEYWNGFTVGVQGSAAEVFRLPEPAPHETARWEVLLKLRQRRLTPLKRTELPHVADLVQPITIENCPIL